MTKVEDRRAKLLEKLQDEFGLTEFAIVGYCGDEEGLTMISSESLSEQALVWLLMESTAMAFGDVVEAPALH